MAIAFVDVDGTLLRGPSSEALFVRHLLATRRIGPRQAYDGLMFFPRWVRSFGRNTAKKNKAYLSGMDMETVGKAAAAFVERDLLRRLRPSVLARIEDHRRKGEIIDLLTGAPDFLAQPLARHVGADLCHATQCAHENGVFLPAPPTRHPFGDEKRALARDICRDHGVDPAACTAYADAIHDLPLLRHVGTAVAVAPDPPLKRIAVREGWEILDDTR